MFLLGGECCISMIVSCPLFAAMLSGLGICCHDDGVVDTPVAISSSPLEAGTEASGSGGAIGIAGGSDPSPRCDPEGDGGCRSIELVGGHASIELPDDDV